jgi:hypothetical protein
MTRWLLPAVKQGTVRHLRFGMSVPFGEMGCGYGAWLDSHGMEVF